MTMTMTINIAITMTTNHDHDHDHDHDHSHNDHDHDYRPQPRPRPDHDHSHNDHDHDYRSRPRLRLWPDHDHSHDHGTHDHNHDHDHDRADYRTTPVLKYIIIGSTHLAIDMSKRPRNWRREVWYITFTILISTIRKYRMEPREATGRNSSRAKLIFTSVSAATASFSLTSSAVSLVTFSTDTRDSSSTKEPWEQTHAATFSHEQERVLKWPHLRPLPFCYRWFNWNS